MYTAFSVSDCKLHKLQVSNPRWIPTCCIQTKCIDDIAKWHRYMLIWTQHDRLANTDFPLKLSKSVITRLYFFLFRAPVSGVYSFTFVIAQRHHYEIRTNLFVDGKVVVGAIAEGIKKYHDTQGTNTVNVHVCKGKPVWVESYSSRGRLEGSKDNFRYTSFSGHILYERK